MSRTLRFLKAAENEYDAAVKWYEQERSEELAEDLIREVRATLERITSMPGMYQKSFRNTRTAIVRRFPYAIVFQENGDEILVVSVFHTSRNPKVWQSRDS